jgi:hypothetical protein
MFQNETYINLKMGVTIKIVCGEISRWSINQINQFYKALLRAFSFYKFRLKKPLKTSVIKINF